MRARGIICGHNVLVSPGNPWPSVNAEHYFCETCQEVRKVQSVEIKPVTVFVTALERQKAARYPVVPEPCEVCGSSCTCCCECNF